VDALTFSMSGAPRGKGRPRAAVRGQHATIYTDANTRKYEASVARLAKMAMNGQDPFTGALSVSLRFRIQPPKSMPKRERAAVLAGEQAYAGRFDIDNLAKSVLDACNSICFVDDKQVMRLFSVKVASERPGVDVKIMPLEPQGISLANIDRMDF